MNQLTPVKCPLQVPALISAVGQAGQTRFWEFFAANIRNQHTPPRLCASDAGISGLARVRRCRVDRRREAFGRRGYIEQLSRERSAPTVKQRLAAIRHLFDWLVTGQIVPVNPAASARGPSHSVKRGKTPVLDPSESARLARRDRRVDARSAFATAR
jgi:integrase/recombinase XerC